LPLKFYADKGRTGIGRTFREIRSKSYPIRRNRNKTNCYSVSYSPLLVRVCLKDFATHTNFSR